MNLNQLYGFCVGCVLISELRVFTILDGWAVCVHCDRVHCGWLIWADCWSCWGFCGDIPLFSRVPLCSWSCVLPLFLCQLDGYFDFALLFFPVVGIGSVLVHLCTMVCNNDYALMILSLSSFDQVFVQLFRALWFWLN
jgi:hypothetical protein